MKDRATIVCRQGDKILLVARDRSRWSFPGGTIRRAESPLEAARRELVEETALVQTGLTYLFQFGGLRKRHHVFFIDLNEHAAPEPCNEISKCHWFSPKKIATLVTSIPTREIVSLTFRHETVTILDPAVSDEPALRVNGTDNRCPAILTPDKNRSN